MSATDTTSTDSTHTTQTGANRAGFTTAIGLVIAR